MLRVAPCAAVSRRTPSAARLAGPRATPAPASVRHATPAVASVAALRGRRVRARRGGRSLTSADASFAETVERSVASGALVAAFGGVWLVASKLSNLDTKFDSLDTKFDSLEKSVDTKIDSLEKSVNAKIDSLEKSVNAKIDNLNKDVKAIDAKLDVIIALFAGVPNALRSMGAAVQQVADGQPVSALAAATPAQLAALLRSNGFGQYAEALGHLSGAEALLQTEASLRSLGVVEGHAKPLLVLLSKQK